MLLSFIDQFIILNFLPCFQVGNIKKVVPQYLLSRFKNPSAKFGNNVQMFDHIINCMRREEHKRITVGKAAAPIKQATTNAARVKLVNGFFSRVSTLLDWLSWKF